MDGRPFLDVAQRLVIGSTEADWRTTVGRAYYALMLEGRSALRRWGFAMPKGEQIHRFVRLRYAYAADADLDNVALALEQLGSLRNKADYELEKPGPFGTNGAAIQALRMAKDALSDLDGVDVDTARRAAAVAAIKKAFH